MKRKRMTRREYRQVNIGLTQEEHAKLHEMAVLTNLSMSRVAAWLVNRGYEVIKDKFEEVLLR